MKFIHTSDLHLGVGLSIEKLLIQYGMMQYILDFVRKEKPDYLVIAGDVFDKTKYGDSEATYYGFVNYSSTDPYVEGEFLPYHILLEFLDSVKSLGCKILVCNGNHDPKMWEKHLARTFDRYTSFGVNTWDNMYYINDNDDYGKYRFVLLPLNECDTKTVEEELKYKIKSRFLNLDTSIRNIIIGHLYTDSNIKNPGFKELLGNLWVVSPDLFNDMDYVALGHRHMNFRLNNTNIYYSGSPINCGYLKDVQGEEIDIEKVCNGYINIVEMREKGNIFVNKKHLYDKELLGFIEKGYEDILRVMSNIKEGVYQDIDKRSCEMIDKWRISLKD